MRVRGTMDWSPPSRTAGESEEALESTASSPAPVRRSGEGLG
jgi:hypothetical protein